MGAVLLRERRQSPCTLAAWPSIGVAIGDAGCPAGLAWLVLWRVTQLAAGIKRAARQRTSSPAPSAAGLPALAALGGCRPAALAPLTTRSYYALAHVFSDERVMVQPSNLSELAWLSLELLQSRIRFYKELALEI